ncbi:polymorphic outer membrane protein, partial [Chlamydia psittaci 08-2626_L3]
FGGGGGRSYSC